MARTLKRSGLRRYNPLPAPGHTAQQEAHENEPASPLAEKDEAKRLGARWDATKRVWYVQNMTDPAAFKRWLPDPESPAPGPGGVTAASLPARPRPSEEGRASLNSL
jgi:hypothetical protein